MVCCINNAYTTTCATPLIRVTACFIQIYAGETYHVSQYIFDRVQKNLCQKNIQYEHLNHIYAHSLMCGGKCMLRFVSLLPQSQLCKAKT